MDLVLPGESSARMKAVRRTRQILFLILPRRAERLKYTGPQFLAFEQSVVDIRRLQSFLVSLAWRRQQKRLGESYKKDRRRGKTFARERIKPCFSWCKRVEVFQRRIKLFPCLPRKFVPVTCYLSKSYC